jgi:GrpB-like predicted nucleotidyltransferase (UPF0157 family)
VIGLESGLVRLVPYQVDWPRLFAVEKERLQVALGDHVLDIQHVGSTAVPGLPAKPIIDIAIAVENFEKAVVCIQPIENLGYTYRGENGIPRRHYFRKGDPRTHHIHMNQITGVDWENQILFRDYLIRHPEAVQAYAALKISLAQKYPADREQYLFEKSPLIQQILHKARLERCKGPSLTMPEMGKFTAALGDDDTSQ